MLASTTLPITADARQFKYLSTVHGEVYITSSPQIQAGNFDGQELYLKGTSDTNFPVFSDGNGLSLNGPLLLRSGEAAILVWDKSASVWTEISRR